MSFPFPENFIDQLEEEIKEMTAKTNIDHGGEVVGPVQAKFQADTLICKKLLTGEGNLAFANDTDFGFLAGKEAIQISSFKLQGRTRETKKLVSMTIMSPSSSTLYV